MSTVKESIISMYEVLGMELTKYDITLDPLDEDKIPEYLAYIDWYFDADVDFNDNEGYKNKLKSFLSFRGFKIDVKYKNEILDILTRYIQSIKILIN
jgi:hypothetical protein